MNRAQWLAPLLAGASSPTVGTDTGYGYRTEIGADGPYRSAAALRVKTEYEALVTLIATGSVEEATKMGRASVRAF